MDKYGLWWVLCRLLQAATLANRFSGIYITVILTSYAKADLCKIITKILNNKIFII